MKAHKWLRSQLDASKCAVCKRPPLDHTPAAICESCTKRADCEIIDGILMCSDCQKRDFATKLEKDSDPSTAVSNPVNASINTEESTTSELINDMADFEADLPANGTEFFNKKVEGIVALQKKIMADDTIPAANKHYHFAKILTARRLGLYKHLIEAKEIIVEIEAENSAIHKAINLLAADLKAEERIKLNIKYAEYVPKTPPNKIMTRRSAEEKVIESIAKTMFAPRNEANIIQWEALEQHERLSLLTKAKDYYKTMFAKKESGKEVTKEAGKK